MMTPTPSHVSSNNGFEKAKKKSTAATTHLRRAVAHATANKNVGRCLLAIR